MASLKRQKFVSNKNCILCKVEILQVASGFGSPANIVSDLAFGLKSSDLDLSVASVLEEVCSELDGHPKSSPSLSSRGLATD